jgi:hypothetical protein
MRGLAIFIGILVLSGPSCTSPVSPSSSPPPSSTNTVQPDNCHAVPGLHDGEIVYKRECD